MSDFSFISNAHPAFIDSLYQQYQQDPEVVEASWQLFFKGFDFGANGNGAAAVDAEHIQNELRVLSLIFAYRNRGHLESTTNPLKPRVNRQPYLAITDFGLTENQLNTPLNLFMPIC